MEGLSAAQARRVALAAQGFGRPRPTGRLDRRHLRWLFDRVGVIQIDSVNALVRSHYLPGWARLGAYSRAALDDAVYRSGELFEYWAHEASLVPVSLQPLLRWRAERARTGQGVWGGLASFGRERPEYVREVRARVTAEGPVAASELAEPGPRGPSAWWGWGDSKKALEWLFWSGQISVASRRGSFERLYDLPERVLPPEILALPTPPEDAAQRGLLRVAAACHGVATARDLGDYFRIGAADTRARVAELVEEGDLLPVRVEGWAGPAYVPPSLVVPRRIAARTLLSPFDSLVWERSRTSRLFGFDLRLEIYTPAAKRRYGYYVLPFLLDDRLVARVDLKSDRASATLLVISAWAQQHIDPGPTVAALREETAALAGWLGLERVAFAGGGDLDLGPGPIPAIS
ncbi:MAG: winged helix-turn-helix domain-containing protein [Frankia sp.]